MLLTRAIEIFRGYDFTVGRILDFTIELMSQLMSCLWSQDKN